jgi:hypothetical protein
LKVRIAFFIRALARLMMRLSPLFLRSSSPDATTFTLIWRHWNSAEDSTSLAPMFRVSYPLKRW